MELIKSQPESSSFLTKEESQNWYLLLVFPLAFLDAALIPLVESLIILTILPGGPNQPAESLKAFSNPPLGIIISAGHLLSFFAIFYQVGKRVDFPRYYRRLGLLTYGGVFAYYSLGIISYAASQGGGLLGYVLDYSFSALASFGLLFGAHCLAFLRTQLSSLDIPPVELQRYRRASVAGFVAFFTNLGSPVVSGFVAAFLYQRGLFQGDFSFLSYYFSGPDPLYVNYIIYPVLFAILLYYLGRNIDFTRRLRQVSVYILVGGFVGSLLGIPLGNYLKVFFNPLTTSSISSSSISQLTMITIPILLTSIFEAAEGTLLGVSVLTIATLRRKSDLPTENGENYGEEIGKNVTKEEERNKSD